MKIDDNESINDKILITEVISSKNSNLNKIDTQSQTLNKKNLPNLPQKKLINQSLIINNNKKFNKKPSTAPISISQPIKPPLLRPSNLPDSIKKNFKLKQGNSILNFNPELLPHFTEEFTLKAIKKLGINELELQYPNEITLNNYSKEPTIRNLVKQKMIKDIDELINKIKIEREKIINENNLKNSNINFELEKSKEEYLKIEEKKLKKIIKNQKKEVEQIIYNILLEQQIEEEEIIKQKKEIELQKQKELELI